ncbi:hypothetical protein DFH08DRAFT_807070 [Mycena albidolilacea]|uniref:Uncharacterized protein n=1 Tax=Mycena albidolilacea TaxID=1033008 RepID=A0AAD7A541_9AGAR|nr:hypothetical protein DFH08DRAFT_807070 [Mycena albidolilacea]
MWPNVGYWMLEYGPGARVGIARIHSNSLQLKLVRRRLYQDTAQGAGRTCVLWKSGVLGIKQRARSNRGWAMQYCVETFFFKLVLTAYNNRYRTNTLKLIRDCIEIRPRGAGRTCVLWKSGILGIKQRARSTRGWAMRYCVETFFQASPLPSSWSISSPGVAFLRLTHPQQTAYDSRYQMNTIHSNSLQDSAAPIPTHRFEASVSSSSSFSSFYLSGLNYIRIRPGSARLCGARVSRRRECASDVLRCRFSADLNLAEGKGRQGQGQGMVKQGPGAHGALFLGVNT